MKLFDKMREEFAEKHVRKLYSKVVKRFLNINRDDIKVEYLPDYDYVGISVLDYYKLIIMDELVKKPTLKAGPDFLRFSEEEKEATIAHELGHYEHDIKGMPEGIKRRTLWAVTIRLYHQIDDPSTLDTLAGLTHIKTESAKRILNFFNKESRFARLQKWNQMCDLDADNKAIDAGYGKGLLSALRKIYDKEYPRIVRPDYLLERIKNLEEKVLKL